MTPPYPPPDLVREARAVLADLLTLLGRVDALLSRLAPEDPTGVTYSRHIDHPTGVPVPEDVAGYPMTARGERGPE